MVFVDLCVCVCMERGVTFGIVNSLWEKNVLWLAAAAAVPYLFYLGRRSLSTVEMVKGLDGKTRTR